jgi:hypothetical protein
VHEALQCSKNRLYAIARVPSLRTHHAALYQSRPSTDNRDEPGHASDHFGGRQSVSDCGRRALHTTDNSGCHCESPVFKTPDQALYAYVRTRSSCAGEHSYMSAEYRRLRCTFRKGTLLAAPGCAHRLRRERRVREREGLRGKERSVGDAFLISCRWCLAHR